MNIKNYNFSGKSFNFLLEIEKDYKNPILIEEKILGEAEHGFAKYVGGIPIIELSITENYKKEVIIHEAYHLRLKFDGMPNIGFELPQGNLSEENRIYLEWFAHLYWDKIMHHFFYYKIKDNLNLDPYFAFKKELDIIFNKNEIKGLNSATKELTLAGHYLQVWVETNDESYFKKFRDFLNDKYDSLGIEKGEYLIKIMKENPLIIFDDCIMLFKKIFDYLHLEQKIKISKETLKSNTNKLFNENYVLFDIQTY